MSTRGWEGEDDDAGFSARRGADARGESENGGDGGAAGADAVNDTAPAAPTTTKRKRNLLTDSHLLSQEGFKKIYQTFPYQTSSAVAGQEAKALSSLIKMYKQWAYDLYPGLNFDDFVDRTEALGKTHTVQGLMSDLRSKEMRRVLGIPEEFIDTADDQPLGGVNEEYEQREADPEESGFIVPGDDNDDDDDGSFSEEEAQF